MVSDILLALSEPLKLDELFINVRSVSAKEGASLLNNIKIYIEPLCDI